MTEMTLTRHHSRANFHQVMNFTLALSSVAFLCLAACGSMDAPISNNGDFDPLRAPGRKLKSASTESPFTAGKFVNASIDNTAFFKARPKGDSDADTLLKRGTSMKVISVSGNYVKVELDSGEVGFVPSVMLEDPSTALELVTAVPGQFQVYPPLPTGDIGEPLPIIDPAGLPPDGAIPTVIDPNALVAETPVPTVTPSTDTFPAPVVPQEVPKKESMPLPPNGEE